MSPIFRRLRNSRKISDNIKKKYKDFTVDPSKKRTMKKKKKKLKAKEVVKEVKSEKFVDSIIDKPPELVHYLKEMNIAHENVEVDDSEPPRLVPEVSSNSEPPKLVPEISCKFAPLRSVSDALAASLSNHAVDRELKLHKRDNASQVHEPVVGSVKTPRTARKRMSDFFRVVTKSTPKNTSQSSEIKELFSQINSSSDRRISQAEVQKQVIQKLQNERKKQTLVEKSDCGVKLPQLFRDRHIRKLPTFCDSSSIIKENFDTKNYNSNLDKTKVDIKSPDLVHNCVKVETPNSAHNFIKVVPDNFVHNSIKVEPSLESFHSLGESSENSLESNISEEIQNSPTGSDNNQNETCSCPSSWEDLLEEIEIDDDDDDENHNDSIADKVNTKNTKIVSSVANQAISQPMNDATHPTDDVTHSADNVTHPTDNVTHPTDNVTHPTDNVTHPTDNVTHPTDNVTHIPVNVAQSTDDVAQSTNDVAQSTDDVLERCIIDDFVFLSFTKLEDMSEYTDEEHCRGEITISNNYGNSTKKGKYNKKLYSASSGFVPTKTKDITKIKGWRKKVFAMDVYVPKNTISSSVDENYESEAQVSDADSQISVGVETNYMENTLGNCSVVDPVTPMNSVLNTKTKKEDVIGTGKDHIFEAETNYVVNKENHVETEKQNVESDKENVKTEKEKFDIEKHCVVNKVEEDSKSLDKLSENGRVSVSAPKNVSVEDTMYEVLAAFRSEKLENYFLNYKRDSGFYDTDKISIDTLKDKCSQALNYKSKILMNQKQTLKLHNSSNSGRTNEENTSQENVKDTERHMLKVDKNAYKSREGIDVNDLDIKTTIIVNKLDCKVRNSEVSIAPKANKNETVIPKFKIYPNVRIKIMNVNGVKNKSNLKKSNYFDGTKSDLFNKLKYLNQFGIVAKPSVGTPLPKVAIAQLQSLRKKSAEIDRHWADFATSLIHTRKHKISKNTVVFPVSYEDLLISQVISKSSIEKAKEEMLLKQEKLKFKSLEKEPVSPEIEDMVNKMVECVVNHELDTVILKDDPDVASYISDVKCIQLEKSSLKGKKKIGPLFRELQKLDVNFIDMDVNEGEEKSETVKIIKDNFHCNQPHCRLGCICNSLQCSDIGRSHCGEEKCIFECCCGYQGNSMAVSSSDTEVSSQRFNLLKGTLRRLQNESSYKLARREKEFKHTVIRAKDETFVVGSRGSSRRRREIKLPGRFRDSVLGKEFAITEIKNITNIEDTREIVRDPIKTTENLHKTTLLPSKLLLSQKRDKALSNEKPRKNNQQKVTKQRLSLENKSESAVNVLDVTLVSGSTSQVSDDSGSNNNFVVDTLLDNSQLSDINSSQQPDTVDNQQPDICKEGDTLNSSKQAAINSSQQSDIDSSQEANIHSTQQSEIACSQQSDIKGSQQSDIKGSQQSDIKDSQQSDIKGSQQSDIKDSQQSDINNSQQSDINNSQQSDINSSQETDDLPFACTFHSARTCGMDEKCCLKYLSMHVYKKPKLREFSYEKSSSRKGKTSKMVCQNNDEKLSGTTNNIKSINGTSGSQNEIDASSYPNNVPADNRGIFKYLKPAKLYEFGISKTVLSFSIEWDVLVHLFESRKINLWLQRSNGVHVLVTEVNKSPHHPTCSNLRGYEVLFGTGMPKIVMTLLTKDKDSLSKLARGKLLSGILKVDPQSIELVGYIMEYEKKLEMHVKDLPKARHKKDPPVTSSVSEDNNLRIPLPTFTEPTCWYSLALDESFSTILVKLKNSVVSCPFYHKTIMQTMILSLKEKSTVRTPFSKGVCESDDIGYETDFALLAIPHLARFIFVGPFDPTAKPNIYTVKDESIFESSYFNEYRSLLKTSCQKDVINLNSKWLYAPPNRENKTPELLTYTNDTTVSKRKCVSEKSDNAVSINDGLVPEKKRRLSKLSSSSETEIKPHVSLNLAATTSKIVNIGQSHEKPTSSGPDNSEVRTDLKLNDNSGAITDPKLSVYSGARTDSNLSDTSGAKADPKSSDHNVARQDPKFSEKNGAKTDLELCENSKVTTEPKLSDNSGAITVPKLSDNTFLKKMKRKSTDLIQNAVQKKVVTENMLSSGSFAINSMQNKESSNSDSVKSKPEGSKPVNSVTSLPVYLVPSIRSIGYIRAVIYKNICLKFACQGIPSSESFSTVHNATIWLTRFLKSKVAFVPPSLNITWRTVTAENVSSSCLMFNEKILQGNHVLTPNGLFEMPKVNINARKTLRNNEGLVLSRRFRVLRNVLELAGHRCSRLEILKRSKDEIYKLVMDQCALDKCKMQEMQRRRDLMKRITVLLHGKDIPQTVKDELSLQFRTLASEFRKDSKDTGTKKKSPKESINEGSEEDNVITVESDNSDIEDYLSSDEDIHRLKPANSANPDDNRHSGRSELHRSCRSRFRRFKRVNLEEHSDKGNSAGKHHKNAIPVIDVDDDDDNNAVSSKLTPNTEIPRQNKGEKIVEVGKETVPSHNSKHATDTMKEIHNSSEVVENVNKSDNVSSGLELPSKTENSLPNLQNVSAEGGTDESTLLINSEISKGAQHQKLIKLVTAASSTATSSTSEGVPKQSLLSLPPSTKKGFVYEIPSTLTSKTRLNLTVDGKQIVNNLRTTALNDNSESLGTIKRANAPVKISLNQMSHLFRKGIFTTSTSLENKVSKATSGLPILIPGRNDGSHSLSKSSASDGSVSVPDLIKVTDLRSILQKDNAVLPDKDKHVAGTSTVISPTDDSVNVPVTDVASSTTESKAHIYSIPPYQTIVRKHVYIQPKPSQISASTPSLDLQNKLNVVKIQTAMTNKDGNNGVAAQSSGILRVQTAPSSQSVSGSVRTNSFVFVKPQMSTLKQGENADSGTKLSVLMNPLTSKCEETDELGTKKSVLVKQQSDTSDQEEKIDYSVKPQATTSIQKHNNTIGMSRKLTDLQAATITGILKANSLLSINAQNSLSNKEENKDVTTKTSILVKPQVNGTSDQEMTCADNTNAPALVKLQSTPCSNEISGCIETKSSGIMELKTVASDQEVNKDVKNKLPLLLPNSLQIFKSKAGLVDVPSKTISVVANDTTERKVSLESSNINAVQNLSGIVKLSSPKDKEANLSSGVTNTVKILKTHPKFTGILKIVNNADVLKGNTVPAPMPNFKILAPTVHSNRSQESSDVKSKSEASSDVLQTLKQQPVSSQNVNIPKPILIDTLNIFNVSDTKNIVQLVKPVSGLTTVQTVNSSSSIPIIRVEGSNMKNVIDVSQLAAKDKALDVCERS